MATRVEDLIRRHRYTVEDYQRMSEAGILGEDERVELIEGEIVDIASIGSRHGGTAKQLASMLVRAVGDLAIVSVKDPVVLGKRSAPQPDLALLRPRGDFYKGAHPRRGLPLWLARGRRGPGRRHRPAGRLAAHRLTPPCRSAGSGSDLPVNAGPTSRSGTESWQGGAMKSSRP